SSRSFASGRDSSSTRTSPPRRSAGSSIACPARSSAPKEASSASAPSTRGSSGTSPEDARTSPTCRTRRARSSSTSIAARGTTSSWDTGEGLRYALEGSAFITGAAVQWLRDGLGLIKSAEETDAIARSIKTNDNVYFVPAFTGLGAPYWDPRARGVLIGLERG